METTLPIASSKTVLKPTKTYIWTIDNFRQTRVKFLTENICFKGDCTKQFRLVLYPIFELDSVLLTNIYGFFSASDVANDEALICISILDSSGNKCLTTEGLSKTSNPGGDYYPQLSIKHNYLINPDNNLLPEGKLTLCYEIYHGEDKFQQTNIENETKKLQTDFQTLLNEDLITSSHSDVTFVIDGKELKLHKNILSVRSPVFRAMFQNDLEEQKQNRVEISDVPYEVFNELVQYMYTGTVPNMREFAYDLFIASDKYQLESLKSVCLVSLHSHLTIETVAQVLLLADMHNEGTLKAKCIQFITDNSKSVLKEEVSLKVLKARPDLLLELYQNLSDSQ